MGELDGHSLLQEVDLLNRSLMLVSSCKCVPTSFSTKLPVKKFLFSLLDSAV